MKNKSTVEKWEKKYPKTGFDYHNMTLGDWKELAIQDYNNKANPAMPKLIDMSDWQVVDFIISYSVQEAKAEMIKKIEKLNVLPYSSSLSQNRNGLDYCSTCEQAWEECSCPARNTGYKRAIEKVLSTLNTKEKV